VVTGEVVQHQQERRDVGGFQRSAQRRVTLRNRRISRRGHFVRGTMCHLSIPSTAEADKAGVLTLPCGSF
jgi:hypothetical protein